ncbi:scarecrow-like protein 14 [Rutidosis leptorrhynchoides]|uniref:scarecrow-like protein 14 n=1 Tax=Rutidosis leptorrhynchoides TaxID=125765 RepID=UPI003A99F51B
MLMESHQNENYDPINGFNGYKFNNEHLDLSFLDIPYPAPDHNVNPGTGSSSVSPDMPTLDSPDEFNDYVFNYIDQIVVEENVEGMQSLFFDPLKLQETERSLYEALGAQYPHLQIPLISVPNLENYQDNLVGSCGGEYSATNTSTSYSNSANSTHPDWPSPYTFDSLSPVIETQRKEYAFTNEDVLNTNVARNIYTDSESIRQFNKGMEEASRFLPSSKPLFIDLDRYNLPQDSRNDPQKVVVKTETVENDKPSNGIRVRKHYQSEDNFYEEERSSKQSAIYVEEEEELSEMFDKVLLGPYANGTPISCCNENPTPVKKNGLTGRAVGKPTTKAIDLSALLISCAQAIAANDKKAANEQLNQIRQHACSNGDAIQRLSHVFVIGIEARLAGTMSQLNAANCDLRCSAAEMLQAYQVYLSACPFKKIAMSFSNKMIYDLGIKSSTIHIVDFGIAYGFQWPIFIRLLSDVPGGPPKLRITGIEYPLTGFRPSERLEETGRRLASYCKRFNVKFEYNAIASQNWDTIKIQDFKLERNEFLAVNSLMRFHNLLDETVSDNSPRDKVLKLIRDMKPDIFVHSVVNGVYSTPFFVTRFKETLFHYSALFDMLDATIERENEQRLNFEKEFFGRGAMNVIACEGAERVERPESYKQWQMRVSRAGFKIKLLDKDLVSKLRCKRAGYHKDFVFDEDGKWILQGWKGRILFASSCWVPV